jgi:hypothetical protein
VDWLERKKWGDEPPLHHLLQSQTYQGLDGVTWGDMIVLVGGNSLERFCYDFRPKLYAEIEARVVTFWQSVRANDPPAPDFGRDGDALAQVLGEPTEEVADLRGDNRADELARAWLDAKADMKAAEKRAEEAKTQLLMKIGSAGYAMLGLHKVSCNQTKGSAGTLVTEEMVGTTVGARKGWRRFDVKEMRRSGLDLPPDDLAARHARADQDGAAEPYPGREVRARVPDRGPAKPGPAQPAEGRAPVAVRRAGQGGPGRLAARRPRRRDRPVQGQGAMDADGRRHHEEGPQQRRDRQLGSVGGVREGQVSAAARRRPAHLSQAVTRTAIPAR